MLCFLKIYKSNWMDSISSRRAADITPIQGTQKMIYTWMISVSIPPENKLLGCVTDDQGICMDLNKVDSVLKWKVLTNRDLLRGFIGSVGYLADNISNIHIPMGVLSGITEDTVPFHWRYTEQCAFKEIKMLVHQAGEHCRFESLTFSKYSELMNVYLIHLPSW